MTREREPWFSAPRLALEQIAAIADDNQGGMAWRIVRDLAQAALREQENEAVTCVCGHSVDWHSHGGTGDCEHNALCLCTAYEARVSPVDEIAAARGDGWQPDYSLPVEDHAVYEDRTVWRHPDGRVLDEHHLRAEYEARAENSQPGLTEPDAPGVAEASVSGSVSSGAENSQASADE